MVRRPQRFALLAALLAGCGPEDSVVNPVERTTRFVPAALDFEQRAVGEITELSTRLERTGGERIQIRDVRFDPDTERFLPRREEGGALRGAYLSPADPIDLIIAFEPIAPGRLESAMYVVFEGGETKLELAGDAFVVEPARAQAEPSSILFQPGVELGRRVAQTFSVRNVGQKAGSVVVISAQPPFSVTEVGGGNISSAAIEPGEARTLELVFNPTSIGAFSKTIKIALGDSAPADINASGEGVEAGSLSCTQTALDFGGVERGNIRDLPVDCTVSGGAYTVQSISTNNPAFALIAGVPGPNTRVTDLHLTVRFTPSGNASTNGRPVMGALAINAAHGANTVLELGGKVIAPEPMGADLKIAIGWSAPGTDFDLHLVRGGELPFDRGEDCYWDAVTLDWGVEGDPDDDPFLDKDARNGMGPEEINLGRANGTYDVYVQYFGSGDPVPNVSVRFDYWLEGAQGMSLTKSMGICGNTWKIGRLDFTTATPQLIVDGAEVNSWVGRAVGCPTD